MPAEHLQGPELVAADADRPGARQRRDARVLELLDDRGAVRAHRRADADGELGCLLSHQAIVIMTLFYIPFGKLFHIVQRPASIGVELYQERSREMEQAVCPRCGTMFIGKMWIDDLKKVVDQLGFDYRMENGNTLQDYCPRCKRVMRGLAYAGMADKKERVFVGTRAENE